MVESQNNYEKLKKAAKMNVAQFLDNTNLPIAGKAHQWLVGHECRA